MNVSPSSPEAPQDLIALWEHANAHLEHEATHQAFIEACVARDQIAFAAKCYKKLADTAEAQGDEITLQLARNQLQHIQGLALSLLKSTAQPPPEFKKAATWAAALICVVLLVAMALAFRP